MKKIKEEDLAKLLEMDCWKLIQFLLKKKQEGIIDLETYNWVIKKWEESRANKTLFPHTKPQDKTEVILSDIFPGGTFL